MSLESVAQSAQEFYGMHAVITKNVQSSREESDNYYERNKTVDDYSTLYYSANNVARSWETIYDEHITVAAAFAEINLDELKVLALEDYENFQSERNKTLGRAAVRLVEL